MYNIIIYIGKENNNTACDKSGRHKKVYTGFGTHIKKHMAVEIGGVREKGMGFTSRYSKKV